MDEHLEEELAIQDERLRPAKTLSAETFSRPIELLCRNQDLAQLAPSATIDELIALMQRRRIGSVLVVKNERLVGIVSERDLLTKVMGRGESGRPRVVEQIMTPNPHVLRATDSIAFAANAMHVGGFRHVPIVDEAGRPLHVISVRDVLAYIVENFPEEIVNLPPTPSRGAEPPWGG